MFVSPDEVEKTILRIFLNMRIPAGSGLQRTALVKAWSQTPLRRNDLDSGIRRLSAMAYVQPERNADGGMVYLTADGHQRMHSLLDQSLEKIRLRLHLLALSLVRWHRPAEPLVHPRRRLIDRASPEAS